jgi:hypothetical protein
MERLLGSIANQSKNRPFSTSKFNVVIEVVDSLLLMVGLALLTPLILLTPAMSWTPRDYGLLGLFMIMVAANVLRLIIFGWSFDRNVTPSGEVALDGVRALVPLVYIALPTFLGGVWAWRFWLPYHDKPREEVT